MNFLVVLSILILSTITGTSPGLAQQTLKIQPTLKIGVEGTYPPFSETLPSGEIVGFDIDLAFALCDEMEVTCTLVPQSWEGMIPALLAYTFDAIIASMSITEERKKIINFTIPYYRSPAAFVGRKRNNIEISQAGLVNRTVGVQHATVSACYLERTFADVLTIKYYDTQENVQLDLTIGRLDLIFAEMFALTAGFLDRPGAKAYEIKGQPIFDPECMGEGVGIAVRKEDTSLLDAFNRALVAIRTNGRYQQISMQYFGFDLYESEEKSKKDLP